MKSTSSLARQVLPLCVLLSALSTPLAQEKPKDAAKDDLPKRITNSVGMKLALVPAGKFIMGSPTTEPDRGHDEKPHEVEITRPYYMGVFEVTQRHYHAVMGENPAGPDKKLIPNNADFPVVMVSWEDAVAFCKKLSALPEEEKLGRVYRLPTEAEWEYACRGGPGVPTTAYHTGHTINSRQANFNGKIDILKDAGPNLGGITKVGAYEPNALGLFDMHANVWEWCLDLFEEGYYEHSPRKDPQGPDTGFMHVLRGGSCYNPGRTSRSANRYRNWSAEYGDAGFRVVCVASSPISHR